MTARQATCVAIGDRGLLIEGVPGSGKSSLALALIDRGAILVGDDSLMVETRDGCLIARPHPQTHGLLEVRNLGLLHFPVREEVAVALVIRLDHEAPRYIETADTVTIEGITLPAIRLWPDGAGCALKVELALRTYGLPSAARGDSTA